MAERRAHGAVVVGCVSIHATQSHEIRQALVREQQYQAQCRVASSASLSYSKVRATHNA